MIPHSHTKAFRLTPTGNPLTEEQIEKWRAFLLNDVGTTFGFSSPVGANVLCDMALAALREQQHGPAGPQACICPQCGTRMAWDFGTEQARCLPER